MRLAIFADIHGNLPALQAVADDIGLDTVDGLVIAGDFTGGPKPQAVIDLLRELDLPTVWVRGNSEHYVMQMADGSAPQEWYDNPAWATLRFSFSDLRSETVDWIKLLPDQATAYVEGAAPVRIVHGTPASAYEFLFPDQQPEVLALYDRAGLLPEAVPPLHGLLEAVKESALICAHSHIPWIDENTDVMVVNAGSVGNSNNGDPRIQYALLDWDEAANRWRAQIRLVDYDTELVRAAYRDSGLLKAGGAMAEAFLLGIVSGTNVPGKLVRYARGMAGLDGYYGGSPPEDTWYRAVDTFDWEGVL
jgi:predicted phosphodiesterase